MIYAYHAYLNTDILLDIYYADINFIIFNQFKINYSLHAQKQVSKWKARLEVHIFGILPKARMALLICRK